MRVLFKLRRHNFSMLIEARNLSQTSTFQLTTHQHSRTMRISHMEVEYSKVQDQCKIFNNNMLHIVPRKEAIRESESRKSGTKEISIL